VKHIIILTLLIQTLFAINSKIIPLISSNPNSGTSVGLVNANIYNADNNSSPSQAMLMAQYSNTDSWSVFGINTTYFDSNKYKFFSVGGYMHNRSELFLEIPIDVPNYGGDQIDANFDVDIYFLLSQLLYEVADDFYLGGQLLYSTFTFVPRNLAGEEFLNESGITDTTNGAYGIVGSYDTRPTDEKYYPHDGNLVDIIISHYPEFFNNPIAFASLEINARDYSIGFKSSDVWANQLYGKYTSENTPDSGLPALGTRSILRGFAAGQFKARYMSVYQTEYRYQLDDTKFRFVGFAGVANLAGGSVGEGGGNRDKDNGNYASAGLGVRYTIQEKAGIDYRVDFAYTSTDEYGLYATVNQAF